MIRPRTKAFTVRTSDGGALVTERSLENVGQANYSAKINWRADGEDKERLREGDWYFRPNTDLPLGVQPLYSAAPITAIAEARRPNGDRSVVAFTQTNIHRYLYATGTWQLIGSGFSASGNRWQVQDLNGFLVANNGVDLPVTFRHEEDAVKPIYELREIGIAAVGIICVCAGFLQCADVTEIRADQLVAWMNGATPYGIPPAGITTRTRYMILSGEFGQPRRWAPMLNATIAAASSTAVLEFPVSAETLAANSLIAVVGGGVNGSNLGGQIGAEDGVKVLSIAGKTVTWDASFPSDSAGVYPMKVSICRFTDISTMVSSSSVQDDSSAILNMVQLGSSVVVFRDTSIFIGRYTAELETPFIYKKIYSGNRTLYYRWAVVNPTGDYLLYAGANDIYVFDGSGEPQPHSTITLAKGEFFTGIKIGDTNSVFAERNAVTNEVWFCSPLRTLAWSYRFNKVDTIDQIYTAVATVARPRAANAEPPDEQWHLMATMDFSGQNCIVQYGLTNEGSMTVQRRGRPYTATIASGMWDLGDPYNEKDVRAYLLQLASSSGEQAVTVSMYAIDDPALPPRLLFPPRTIQNPKGHGLIPLLYRQTFFKDVISVTTAKDIMVTLSGRTFEVKGDYTRSRQRTESE